MGPGAYPPQPTAFEQIRLPATFLLVTGVLGALGAVVSLLANLLGAGIGMAGLVPNEEAFDSLMTGTVGVISAIVGLAVSGLIVFGALRMKELRTYPLAMAATVVAMIPCLSPCCLLGLPVGIWALVVLLKPEVKAAFRP
jgi:hypothetical protein